MYITSFLLPQDINERLEELKDVEINNRSDFLNLAGPIHQVSAKPYLLKILKLCSFAATHIFPLYLLNQDSSKVEEADEDGSQLWNISCSVSGQLSV